MESYPRIMHVNNVNLVQIPTKMKLYSFWWEFASILILFLLSDSEVGAVFRFICPFSFFISDTCSSYSSCVGFSLFSFLGSIPKASRYGVSLTALWMVVFFLYVTSPSLEHHVVSSAWFFLVCSLNFL